MNRYKAIKINGKKHDLHRYIMESHIGRKISFNEVVHHINGDKTDNRIENLEIMDRSMHSRNHMIGNKLSDTAKRKLRKLTVEQVIEIRKLKGNMSKRKVANIFNVGSATIQDIWCGKTWN